MFDVIEVENKPYYLSVTVCDNRITCQLTDLAEIWLEEIGIPEFYVRVREDIDTPEIQYEDKIILDAVTNKAESFLFNKVENLLSFKYYFPKSRVPFRIIWRLKCCDREQFKNLLTMPLLNANFRMHNQIAELLDIINKKDIEIDQYKLDGAKLLRTNLGTEKFDAAAFRNQHDSDDFFAKLNSLNDDKLKALKKSVNISTPTTPTRKVPDDSGEPKIALSSPSTTVGFISPKVQDKINKRIIKQRKFKVRNLQFKYEEEEDNCGDHQSETVPGDGDSILAVEQENNVCPAKISKLN